MTVDILDVADRLDCAQRQGTETGQLGANLTSADAYEIQHRLLAHRHERGEALIGTKLGLTSKAKMAQMGVTDVIVGQLTDAMAVPDGGDLELSGLIHPRVEPEVAFRLARDVDLDDPDLDIVSCVDAVAPGLEIIDSRYASFRFSLTDVIADNTSAAFFVVGAWQPLPADIANRKVELTVDGEIVESGNTGEILGDPLEALRALLSLARKHRFPLNAGQVILAGAATAAVPLILSTDRGRSTVRAVVAGLGEATVHAVAGSR